jgi:putative tricarboxylic transport membrane protein
MYSFFTAFQPSMMLLCFSGAALGIVWAALPGLSTTMAMALLVGLTYNMPTEPAIIFILGTFTGSVFGGAISAVLINIPGTPDAVPTQMAGFPLAQKGQGGQVLGMSITASMVGNWIGILLLVTCVGYVLDIALQFASWEVALLALWGVSICGSLTSGEAPVKGWISGWLGILLAMVGREEIHGVERFTFGNAELLLGIPYIPVLIGLFGMTEIFMVLSQPHPYVIPQKIGRIFPPLKDFFKYWKSIARSSLVGLLTGIIPGAGANVATFVSYGIGERFSGRRFSKGDMEGVICSEVANNANIGGALLPSLVLGIPGSATTAAFLAALNLHGIVVGPTIELEQPGIMYFMYGTLIVANIGMYLCAFALIKPSVRLFSLPREILLPIIALLCVLGAFAQKMSMFDIYLMFGFGVLGLCMRKVDIPIGPLVLGVILGNMLDQNFRRAMYIFEDKSMWQILIDRPLGTVLIAVVLITFINGIWPRKKKPKA